VNNQLSFLIEHGRAGPPVEVSLACTGQAWGVTPRAQFRATPRPTVPDSAGRRHGRQHRSIDQLQRNRDQVYHLRSTDRTEFTAPGALAMDFVFMLWNQAAAQADPGGPVQPNSGRGGVANPDTANGADEKAHRTSSEASNVLSRHICRRLRLPIETLNRMSLQHEMVKIHRLADTVASAATA